MATSIKQTMLRALAQYEGDNLQRAQAAWRGLSPEEMNKPYGQSGKTRYQILDEYRQHVQDVTKARAWVENTL